MKKLFYMLLFFCIMFLKISFAKAYDEYKIGDKVTYNNIDFYVIKDSSENEETLTLLKADVITKDEIGDLYNSTEIKDKIIISDDYIFVPYYSTDTCASLGDQSGCSINYETSDVKQLVDVWSNKYLKDADLVKDSTGYSVRLLTYDELIDKLGSYYEYVTPSGSSPQIILKYDWLGDATKKYWTMASYQDNNNEIYFMSDIGGLSRVYLTNTVRPVVTIKKTSIDKELVYPSYKIGDEITYKGIEFYVIKGSDKYTNYVTLLKKTPLTTSEVDKYGYNHINMYSKDFSHFTMHNPQYDYVRKAYDQGGYGVIAYYTSETCADKSDNTTILDGCTNDYKISDVKYVVDAWTDDLLDNSDLIKDDLGYKSRLITYEELVDLGFEKNGNTGLTSYSMPETMPKWIREFCYWTMSPYNDSTNSVWLVCSDNLEERRVLNTNAFIVSGGTVRPIINLKKDTINDDVENKSSEEINEQNKISESVIVPDTMKKISVALIIIGILLILSSVAIVIINRYKTKNK